MISILFIRITTNLLSATEFLHRQLLHQKYHKDNKNVFFPPKALAVESTIFFAPSNSRTGKLLLTTTLYSQF